MLFQNVQANAAITIDVGVIHLCLKIDLWSRQLVIMVYSLLSILSSCINPGEALQRDRFATDLGWLEGIIRWKVDFHHEDAPGIWTIARPASAGLHVTLWQPRSAVMQARRVFETIFAGIISRAGMPDLPHNRRLPVKQIIGRIWS